MNKFTWLLVVVAIAITTCLPKAGKAMKNEEVSVFKKIPDTVPPLKMKMWPNPATTDYINVRTDTSFNGRITLFNSAGKKLYEQEFQNGYANLSLRYSKTKLMPNAIYTTVIQSHNGKFKIAGMFVKQ